MAENAAARFFSSAFCNLACDDFTDSAETKFAAFHVALHLFAMFWPRALCDDNNSPQVTRRLARFDRAGDFVEIEWNFRNQNNIGSSSDGALQRNTSRGAAPYTQ